MLLTLKLVFLFGVGQARAQGNFLALHLFWNLDGIIVFFSRQSVTMHNSLAQTHSITLYISTIGSGPTVAIVPKTEDIIILEDHEHEHEIRCVLSNSNIEVKGVSWYLENKQLYDPTEGYYFISGNYDDKKFSQEFKLMIKNEKLTELKKKGGPVHKFTCKANLKQGSGQEEIILAAAKTITIFSPSKTSNDSTLQTYLYQYRCEYIQLFSDCN